MLGQSYVMSQHCSRDAMRVKIVNAVVWLSFAPD